MQSKHCENILYSASNCASGELRKNMSAKRCCVNSGEHIYHHTTLLDQHSPVTNIMVSVQALSNLVHQLQLSTAIGLHQFKTLRTFLVLEPVHYPLTGMSISTYLPDSDR